MGDGRELRDGLCLVVENGVDGVVVSNVVGNKRVMVRFANFKIALVVARLDNDVIIANL